MSGSVSIHVEVMLAAGYGLFLVLIALGLELAARHTHRRATQYHTAGLTYQAQFDRYVCPRGVHLWRIAVDHRRLAVYRAPAHMCNACPIKGHCTDSDDGRAIHHALDPWIASEIGRFHRGLSLALLALAVLVMVVALARHHTTTEVAVLGVALVSVGAIGLRRLSTFRRRETTQL